MEDKIFEFIKQSNELENIFRDPTQDEIKEFKRFITLPAITISEIERFLSIYQPDAKLRNEYGLNVKVDNYYPPFGSPEMGSKLNEVLTISDPFLLHMNYEFLHPFTDGNGRSGRALYAWAIKDSPRRSLGWKNNFLTNFYFEALNNLSKSEYNKYGR